MTVQITKYNPKDLKNILNFLKRHVYTKRTEGSWVKNSMTAIVAKDKKKIVGILPFEKVNIKIHNKFENVMWISSLFLLSKYRNKKLGKKILELSKKIFSKKVKYFFVMREDPKSKAYKWYTKNGFKVISRIQSLEKKIPSFKSVKVNYRVLNTFQSFKKNSQTLSKVFNDNFNNFDGYKKRSLNFWYNLKFHYYKHKCNYKIVILKAIDKNEYHYALVAKTKMRDKKFRLDILEFCSQSFKFRKLLLYAIENFAQKNNCLILRTQLSIMDKNKNFFVVNKFRNRWETNVMAKNLFKNYPSFKNFKYFQTEYI